MPLIQIRDDNPTGKAESHFRNVEDRQLDRQQQGRRRWSTSAAARGRSRRRRRACRSTCTTGSARAARRWSSAPRSPEYKAEPDKYRAEAPLTGDESRVGRGDRRRVPRAARPGRRPAAADGHHARRARAGQALLVRGTRPTTARSSACSSTARRRSSTRPRGQWEVQLASVRQRPAGDRRPQRRRRGQRRAAGAQDKSSSPIAGTNLVPEHLVE